MKTHDENAVESNLKYREVLQNNDALFHEKKPTVHQIRNIIRMATSCSKSPNLQGTKKKEMRDIADTWQKISVSQQKERKGK